MTNNSDLFLGYRHTTAQNVTVSLGEVRKPLLPAPAVTSAALGLLPARNQGPGGRGPQQRPQSWRRPVLGCRPSASRRGCPQSADTLPRAQRPADSSTLGLQAATQTAEATGPRRESSMLATVVQSFGHQARGPSGSLALSLLVPGRRKRLLQPSAPLGRKQ